MELLEAPSANIELSNFTRDEYLPFCMRKDRERCHQRQLQNLHNFQQAVKAKRLVLELGPPLQYLQQERERDHQRQLQQMRKTHEVPGWFRSPRCMSEWNVL